MGSLNKSLYKESQLSQILHLVKMFFRIRFRNLLIPLLSYTICLPIIVISLKKTLIPNLVFQLIILISILQNNKGTNNNILYKSIPLEKHILILSKYIFAIIVAIVIIVLLFFMVLIFLIAENNNILVTTNILNFNFFFYKTFIPLIYFIIIFIPVSTFFYYLNLYGVIMISAGSATISLTWFKGTIYKLIGVYSKILFKINEHMFLLIVAGITFVCLILSIVASTTIYKHRKV